MDFNNRSNLSGQHAFLAASSPAWLGYDLEKLDKVWATKKSTLRADELHRIAADLISNRIKLPEVKKTFNMYVNDAIGFRMSPEQVLFYSGNCFGTADAISFRDNELRIHDLKNGLGKTDIRQLRIYAALFCLEYRHRPFDIKTILRIYQGNGIREEVSDPQDIVRIMEHIKLLDQRLSELRLSN